MSDVLKLIQYNTWANKRLIAQVDGLSQEQFEQEIGGSFPSLQKTIVHLLHSDWIWMHRFKGIPLVSVPNDWKMNTTSDIKSLWLPIQSNMEETIKNLAGEENRMLKFITKRGDHYEMTFVDAVVHIANHGTYHRGQIANMLRILGEAPEHTDYFIFCTEKHP